MNRTQKRTISLGAKAWEKVVAEVSARLALEAVRGDPDVWDAKEVASRAIEVADEVCDRIMADFTADGERV